MLGAFFMIKTKKHYTYFENEKIYKDLGQSESLLIKLDELKFKIQYNLSVEEDPKLQNLTITKLPKTDFNALIISYIHLLEGVAIEAVKRISLKEFDFFLREVPTESAFLFYSPELYQIFRIGEEIYKKHFPDQVITEVNLMGKDSLDYYELSFSEQVELLEEFLAMYVYMHKDYKSQGFELLEVSNSCASVLINGRELTQNLQEVMEQSFLQEFSINIKFVNYP